MFHQYSVFTSMSGLMFMERACTGWCETALHLLCWVSCHGWLLMKSNAYHLFDNEPGCLAPKHTGYGRRMTSTPLPAGFLPQSAYQRRGCFFGAGGVTFIMAVCAFSGVGSTLLRCPNQRLSTWQVGQALLHNNIDSCFAEGRLLVPVPIRCVY